MFTEHSRKRMRDYWRNVTNSAHCKMSRGAEYITRIMAWPKKDGWRRYSRRDEK